MSPPPSPFSLTPGSSAFSPETPAPKLVLPPDLQRQLDDQRLAASLLASAASGAATQGDGQGGATGDASASSSSVPAAAPRFRLVLSPTRTPASALLVPRRLAALPASPAPPGQRSATAAAAAAPARAPSSESAAASDGPAAAAAARTALSSSISLPTVSSPPPGRRELEVSARAMATAEALALRVGGHGGAALIIDYGGPGCGGGLRFTLAGRDVQFGALMAGRKVPGIHTDRQCQFSVMKRCFSGPVK